MDIESSKDLERVRAAVVAAAAAVMCVDESALLEQAGSPQGLRFDSPQAEAVVARAEEALGEGELAEVADLALGEPATLDTLTDLLVTKLAEKRGVGA